SDRIAWSGAEHSTYPVQLILIVVEVAHRLAERAIRILCPFLQARLFFPGGQFRRLPSRLLAPLLFCLRGRPRIDEQIRETDGRKKSKEGGSLAQSGRQTRMAAYPFPGSLAQ